MLGTMLYCKIPSFFSIKMELSVLSLMELLNFFFFFLDFHEYCRTYGSSWILGAWCTITHTPIHKQHTVWPHVCGQAGRWRILAHTGGRSGWRDVYLPVMIMHSLKWRGSFSGKMHNNLRKPVTEQTTSEGPIGQESTLCRPVCPLVRPWWVSGVSDTGSGPHFASQAYRHPWAFEPSLLPSVYSGWWSRLWSQRLPELDSLIRFVLFPHL